MITEFILLLLAICSVSTEDVLTVNVKHMWDCSGYYACVFGKPVLMPNCAPGWTFSMSARVCVLVGSPQADCIPGTRPTLPDCGQVSAQEQCQLGGIMANPMECHTYYNCSHRYDGEVPRFFEQYMQECPYPQLFNEETGMCNHFELVRCGNRREYTNGCDYRRNKCQRSHCIPCSFRFPNCDGKPDGIHAHEEKLWSSSYIFCYKQRYISQTTCQPDGEGWAQLFHPEVNRCVPVYMIPREHGGAMPNCNNRTDGFYPDEFGRCDRYTICRSNQFLSRGKCLDGTVFDTVQMECEQIATACGRCGKGNC